MSFCLDPELLSPPICHRSMLVPCPCRDALTDDVFQLSYSPSLPSEGCPDWGFAALHQTPSSLPDDDALSKPPDQIAYSYLAGRWRSVLNTPLGLSSPSKWHDLLQLFLERECSAPTAPGANVDFDCQSPQPLFGPRLPSPGTCPVEDGQGQDGDKGYSTILQSSPVTAGTASEVATLELRHETAASESSPESKRKETARRSIICASPRTRHRKSKSNLDHKCIEKNYRDRLNSGFKNLTRALEACGDNISGNDSGISVYNEFRAQSKGAVLQLATARLERLQRENKLLASELKWMKGLAANL